MEGKGCQQTHLCQSAGLSLPLPSIPFAFPLSQERTHSQRVLPPRSTARPPAAVSQRENPRADILLSPLERKNQRYWLPLQSSCTSSCSRATKTSHCPKTRHFTTAALTFHKESGQQDILHHADTLLPPGKADLGLTAEEENEHQNLLFTSVSAPAMGMDFQRKMCQAKCSAPVPSSNSYDHPNSHTEIHTVLPCNPLSLGKAGGRIGDPMAWLLNFLCHPWVGHTVTTPGQDVT